MVPCASIADRDSPESRKATAAAMLTLRNLQPGLLRTYTQEMTPTYQHSRPILEMGDSLEVSFQFVKRTRTVKRMLRRALKSAL
jgi:hypothetical protein